jgi:hypothetical protein
MPNPSNALNIPSSNIKIDESIDISREMSRLAEVAAAAEINFQDYHDNDTEEIEHGQLVEEEGGDGEETLELVFDPETNSYFDPSTGKYYDIEPDTDGDEE